MNRLLINIFDPVSIKIVAAIRIQTQIFNPNFIYIKNWSILIEIGQKWTDFVIFNIVFDINWLLIDFYDLLLDHFDLLIEYFDPWIKLFDLFIDLLIESDQV